MQDFLTVTGIVLKQEDIGEFDRKLSILTKERGKITAYAKNARRQNSRMLATTNPLCFGQFKLTVYHNSYGITEADIQDFFAEIRDNLEHALYGMYFLEIADYYARENNDEKELLKLLYQSLRALKKSNIEDELVRYIYEMKVIAVNGEFPGLRQAPPHSSDAEYTVNFIIHTTIEKLYTFCVSPSVLAELSELACYYRKCCIDREFHSLELLEMLKN